MKFLVTIEGNYQEDSASGPHSFSREELFIVDNPDRLTARIKSAVDTIWPKVGGVRRNNVIITQVSADKVTSTEEVELREDLATYLNS